MNPLGFSQVPHPPVLLQLPTLVGAAMVFDHNGASVRILAVYCRHTLQGDPFVATLGFQRLSTDVMRGMGVEPWRKFTGVPVIYLVVQHLP